jgi:hypothetical protein
MAFSKNGLLESLKLLFESLGLGGGCLGGDGLPNLFRTVFP